MNRKQTPGRVEALREVMRNGIANATPGMLHLAGFNRPVMRAPAAPSLPCFTMESGAEKISEKDRAALPF